MCDDHGPAPRGPGALPWGRATLLLGVPALLAVGIAAAAPAASDLAGFAGLAAGPLVALAGWSLAGFLGGASDAVAARLVSPAYVVAGAALASGTSPFDPSGAVVLGAAAIALGAALARHPLFGPRHGAAGVAIGIAVAALGPWVPAWAPALAWLAWHVVLGVRTAGAVRRLSRGYAPWPEPALV